MRDVAYVDVSSWVFFVSLYMCNFVCFGGDMARHSLQWNYLRHVAYIEPSSLLFLRACRRVISFGL